MAGELTLSSWRVSAPHRMPPKVGSSEPPVPYGVAHARVVGEAATACGTPAVGWPFFWELPFRPWSGAACAACSEAVHVGTRAGVGLAS